MKPWQVKIAKLAKEKATLKTDLLKNHGERKIQEPAGLPHFSRETRGKRQLVGRHLPIIYHIALRLQAQSQAADSSLEARNRPYAQDVTVEMAINGARAIKSMVTETSDLDANSGIAYRHLSLPPGASVKQLPTASF